jgi:hypothetical protein
MLELAGAVLAGAGCAAATTLSAASTDTRRISDRASCIAIVPP